MKIKRFCLAIAAMFSLPARSSLAVNIATALPPAEGVLNLLPTAAHAANVLVKWGANQNTYDLCGVGDIPLGIVTSAVLAGETSRTQAVYLLGSWRKPELVTASEAIAFTDFLFPAANGQVQNTPASGTHYQIGRAIAAGASGSTFPVQHSFPVKVVVS